MNEALLYKFKQRLFSKDKDVMAICSRNGAYEEHLWKKVPLVYGSHMYYLLRMLGLNFDEQAYQLAVQLSSIHKLTYKLKQCGIDPEKKGTFYDYILHHLHL